ncbi:signal peptidase I [Candidatus Palauibacter polyketidifaciens]|uniref:signal peptidase I n=1 Tax=Candidatus Palauibacter polyketidifaciens TaxID=3056740 RepID=UPI0023863A02|nr:signal peptidase I [Candidatus Palauibacter polyketidifaciens]MDE2719368.1 signal peptidase I [Candidatus Palauibacter polyketidifaciens]
MARDRKVKNGSGEADEAAGGKRERSPSPPAFSAAWFRDWGRTLFVALLIFLFFRTFLLATFVITSGSMEGTLLVGDFLLVNKTSLGAPIPFTNARIPGYAEPEYGDIIVFRADHSPGLDIVKRTLGLPGDTLRMEGGILYRNGVALDEPYVRRNPRQRDEGDLRMQWQVAHLIPDPERGEYKPTRDNWGPLVVPPERYFMLGDNREESLDSRYWGFVERGKMQGRPFFIYFSYDREALKPVKFITAMRPGRIGPSPD